jgi:hypothetical protein
MASGPVWLRWLVPDQRPTGFDPRHHPKRVTANMDENACRKVR